MPPHDESEYAEVRGTRWEVRSIKSGRLRLQVFSIDNKWRAARLAELSLRTSHLVLRTFVGTTKSIVNLKNLHKCLIYADFTLLGYRHAGDAVCLPYPLRPRREFLALSFGFLSAALPLIKGEFRTFPFPPLAATCRCIHL